MKCARPMPSKSRTTARARTGRSTLSRWPSWRCAMVGRTPHELTRRFAVSFTRQIGGMFQMAKCPNCGQNVDALRLALMGAVRNIEHHWIRRDHVNTENLSGRVFESVFSDEVIEA